jgi:hypothetical protein
MRIGKNSAIEDEEMEGSGIASQTSRNIGVSGRAL